MSSSIDEQDRQMKQAEMIRQYLQITNIDSNLPPPATPISLYSPTKEVSPGPSDPPTNKVKATNPSSSSIEIGSVSIDFHQLRKEVEQAEERVERLRQELKDLQRKREENLLRLPASYMPPSPSPFAQFPLSIHRRFSDQSTPSLHAQFQRPVLNLNARSNYFLPNSGFSNDDRHRQFLLTMEQHREQLLIYLNSMKQALSSLDRLASLEPSRCEKNMKLETIQQKSRQLEALKSTRSAQHSPFIECRIRQLERDLIQMLGEHQKDVQTKLDLNEQRSLMLMKIMQVNDELAALDQQIEQISPTSTNNDPHHVNPSSSAVASASTTSGAATNEYKSPPHYSHPLSKFAHTFHLHGN